MSGATCNQSGAGRDRSDDACGRGTNWDYWAYVMFGTFLDGVWLANGGGDDVRYGREDRVDLGCLNEGGIARK